MNYELYFGISHRQSLQIPQYIARGNKMHGVATTYSGAPPPNCHAEWPFLRSISYSLPRAHGIPSSYTRLIGCGKRVHITLLQSVVCLLASYSRTGCGGPSTPMGGTTSGSSATHVQAVCGGASTPMGDSYLRIKHPPWTWPRLCLFLRSKKPWGHHTPE